MSDSLGIILAVVVSEVLPAGIAGYAAYWALSVRRALAGRMYRNHALLLGIVGILVAMVGFLTYSTNQIINDLLTVFYSAVFPFLFAFVDSTIPVARRSDPLLRSILHWNRLRFVLWGEAFALAIVTFIPAASPEFVGNSSAASLGNLVWPLLATTLFGISGAALVIGARRSRDQILKGSLKWMGLCLLVFVLGFVGDTIVTSLPGVTTFDFYYSYYAVPTGLLSIVGTYFLYRSSRSLAPINPLQPAQLDVLPQGATTTVAGDSTTFSPS